MTALAGFEDDADRPVPVDPPRQRVPLDATVLGARTVHRWPILPPWMRSRSEFRALAVWLSKYAAHSTAFHTTHSPLYLARLLARMPRGGWLVLVAVANWALDRKQAPIRADAVKRNAVAEYLSLSKQRKERVKHRAIVVLVCTVLATIGGWVFIQMAPLAPRRLPGRISAAVHRSALV